MRLWSWRPGRMMGMIWVRWMGFAVDVGGRRCVVGWCLFGLAGSGGRGGIPWSQPGPLGNGYGTGGGGGEVSLGLSRSAVSPPQQTPSNQRGLTTLCWGSAIHHVLLLPCSPRRTRLLKRERCTVRSSTLFFPLSNLFLFFFLPSQVAGEGRI